MNNKISAHVLVKNEARFIWYSVMSVINYVDKIRIWDTGSTDGTLEIIDEIMKTDIAKDKVLFNKFNMDNFNEYKFRQKMIDSESEDSYNTINSGFTEARQKMLDSTNADWFMVVDGDEIWWDESIKKVTETIRSQGNKIESIVTPTFNVVGDMFHYQEKEAGRYHLLGRVGHYTIRAVKRGIPGLKAYGEHGIFSWRDSNNLTIENRNRSKMLFLDDPLIHTTHLMRSDTRLNDKNVFKRNKKLKHEIGIPFPPDFYYPEVFFRDRPKIVPSVWDTPDSGFKIKSYLETPLRKIYRRTLMKYKKHGY